MKKPIVFITQVPFKYDSALKSTVPTVNITPASEYGEIKIMIEEPVNFFETKKLTDDLWEILKDYDYNRGDSLVCMGDPIIIAAAVSLLARHKGSFKLLKWDKNIKRYQPITFA